MYPRHCAAHQNTVVRPVLASLLFVSCAAAQNTPAPKYDPANINFGFGGILPKDVAYQPMSNRDRWRMFLNEEFKNPAAYFRSVGTAFIDQRRDSPSSWGDGASGYSRRVASRFGKFAAASGIEHASAAALGHDPRYIRCKCDGFWPRFGHALAYQVISYDRNGNRVFYVPRIAGAFGGEALSTAWVPGQKWYVEGYQGAIQQVTLGALMNAVREFGPELKRTFRGRKQ